MARPRVVILGGGFGGLEAVPYGYLIVSTGARHPYFGRPEWEADAPGLKTIEDAPEIRNRFLRAFELAGAMPAIARRAMRRDFRRIDTARTRVLLLYRAGRVPVEPDLSVPGRPRAYAYFTYQRGVRLITGLRQRH